MNFRKLFIFLALDSRCDTDEREAKCWTIEKSTEKHGKMEKQTKCRNDGNESGEIKLNYYEKELCTQYTVHTAKK